MSAILVIDSGIGGLSIYEKIKEKISDAPFIYLCDNAAFPYGEKTEKFIIDRLFYLIDAVKKNHELDMIVIACNTASTICLPALRSRYALPIVGVVPAIKVATQLSQNKIVGLLATQGTLQRAYTAQLIKEHQRDCAVFTLGISELAPLAEKKMANEIIDLMPLVSQFEPLKNKNPDVIVLGCTHYPFLLPELQKQFPKALFIDSAEAVANRVLSLHQSKKTIDDSKKNALFLSTKPLNNQALMEKFEFFQKNLK